MQADPNRRAPETRLHRNTTKGVRSDPGALFACAVSEPSEQEQRLEKEHQDEQDEDQQGEKPPQG